MSLTKAEFIAAFTSDKGPWFIACCCIAALWAGFRPDMVRDVDGRRLPSSVSARLTFIVFFVLAYITVAFALLLLPTLVGTFDGSKKVLEGIFGEMHNAPFLALLAIFSLYSIAPFREIERNVLAWMHDTRHLRGDIQVLGHHLIECDFHVTPEEQRENIRGLEHFDVYITDAHTEGINLESVVTWRKTASLLRRVRIWNSEDPHILSEEERASIDDIERAHGRKTRLAMDIIRMLERVREGGDLASALSNITDVLARASHGNRRGVAELEEKVQAELSSPEQPAAAKPLRLTSSELHDHLKKIEGYFLVEYRLLLERIARLAAKSILHSGDRAVDRLDELKGLGFQGLGSIRPLTTNRILWLFLSVTIGGYLIYYVLWYDEVRARLKAASPGATPEQLAAQGRSALVGIAIFVTSIALASMAAALLGSNSSNARAKETPWGRYLGAALLATIAFFVMQGVRELVIFSVPALSANQYASGAAPGATKAAAPSARPVGESAPGEPQPRAPSSVAELSPLTVIARLQQSAPWSVLPAVTALVICWLSRQSMPASPRNLLGDTAGAACERLIDGLVLGLCMIPAFVISIGLIELVGFKLPPVFIEGRKYDPAIIGILCLVGFFVGATVVREVRAAAHAQVTAPKERRIAGQKAKSKGELAGRPALNGQHPTEPEPRTKPAATVPA